MKIAHYAPLFLPTIGGAEIFVHNIAAEHSREGHDVTVIVPWRCWRAVRGRLPYRVLPLLPRTTAFALARVRQREWAVGFQLEYHQTIGRFDIWHIHTAYPGAPLARAFLQHRRTPSILTAQGADVQVLASVGYGYRLVPRIEQLIAASLQPIDRIVAISESMRADILSLGVHEDRLRVVPNGVDTVGIKKLRVDRDAVRASMNISPEAFVLLTVGRAHPKKGFSSIPHVISLLLQQREDFIWVLVGRETESILPEARALGVTSRIRVMPQIAMGSSAPQRYSWSLPTDELIRLYKTADIFVFPSLIEGFGIVLAEALAAGLPIVTTDAPGCRDVVHHGLNGLLSAVGDHTGMAKHILALMADGELRTRLARAAATTAEGYDWQYVAHRYEVQYHEIVREYAERAAVRTR